MDALRLEGVENIAHSESAVTIDGAHVRAELKQALGIIKEDLDNHLDTINQNTLEIQSNYEYLMALETKLDKLTERMDEIFTKLVPEQQIAQDIELTTREQEVFLVLYTSTVKVSALQVARRLGLTEDMVHNYLYNLIAKKIPIKKLFDDGQMLFELDVAFKDMQARKNMLHINEHVSKELLKEKML
jgi:hypothetical protein